VAVSLILSPIPSSFSDKPREKTGMTGCTCGRCLWWSAYIESSGGVFRVSSEVGQVDLEVRVLPNAGVQIEKMRLQHMGAAVAGSTSEGFQIVCGESALEIELDEVTVSDAPFWIKVEEGVISYGYDRSFRTKKPGWEDIPPGPWTLGRKTHFREIDPIKEGLEPPPGHGPWKDNERLHGISTGPGIEPVIFGGLSISVGTDVSTESRARRTDRRRMCSRNSPCSCGSGKKRKRCCFRTSK
jgi:hypothetical protein